MDIVKGDFPRDGYAVIELPGARDAMRKLCEKFQMRFAARFTDNATHNRNLIKLFAEDIEVKQFFAAAGIVDVLTRVLGIVEPVHTGPIVTHYTANDRTGGNYGLPYHQDYPSMGTSTRGVVVWTSLTAVGPGTPGLRIVPGSHAQGLWPGDQTDFGYVLLQQDIAGHLDLAVEAGQIVLMSPYLVHKTRTAQEGGWKLSLSCRFDDLACEQWQRRGYVSSYRTAVDRSVYLLQP